MPLKKVRAPSSAEFDRWKHLDDLGALRLITEDVSDTEFDRWLKNRAATRTAFAECFQQTPEELLSVIERDALQWMQYLSQNKTRVSGRVAAIRRAAFSNLNFCAVTLSEPPPTALRKLIGLLMGVKPERSQIKNKKMFLAAADFVARNPDATVTRIKRAIKYDHRQIVRWLGTKEPNTKLAREFRAAVARRRQSMRNQEILARLKAGE